MVSYWPTELRHSKDKSLVIQDPQINGSSLKRARHHNSSPDIFLGGKLKRFFDIYFSLLAVFILFIPAVIIAIIIRVSSPGPIIFKHKRVGHKGRSFECMKFRTMHVEAENLLKDYLAQNPIAFAEFEKNRKLKDDPRIIPILGKFLRKTSLDEIPQFYNVLLGEMSIVGPRPVTTCEISLYGESAVHYLATRPGITGLWQISGRNKLSFSERVAIDSDYVRYWSFEQDIKIVIKTLKVVIKGSGAY